MTHLTTRETLSEHYKATRQRLGDQLTPTRPIIPIDRIKPPEAAPQVVVRRPEPELEPVTIPAPKPNARKYVHVIHEVATKHGITVDELIGSSRVNKFVFARQEAFYLLREAGYSMLQIGRFCNRDHTTVMHGANKHEAKLKGGGQ